LAGAAAWGLCALAAAETLVYSDDFESGTLAQRTQWSFAEVHAGSPVLLSTTPESLPPTRFLAEFGGDDAILLSLVDLPADTAAVRLRFRAYLLRTWDGTSDPPYSGPDVFGYGIDGAPPIVRASFSNGAGLQTYCPFSPTPECEPTWGSDALLKNTLGFEVELDPADGSTVPAKGTPLSLAYHFDSVVPYSGTGITFRFFSAGLQVHEDLPNRVIDESWGLDNVWVSAQPIPEPQAAMLFLAGLVLLGGMARRRRHPRS
jgi:hypothetical protein